MTVQKIFSRSAYNRLHMRIAICVLPGLRNNSSIVKRFYYWYVNKSLNSLLYYKYVDRPVDENTLPLEIQLIFHDTCNFVVKCSKSVSHFRTCAFHFSHPKWFVRGVG